MGTRPACSLGPGPCDLHSAPGGRQEGAASLPLPSKARAGADGSGLQEMAPGAQGDAGAGLGRQVQPEEHEAPHGSWPAGPSESACSPERPSCISGNFCYPAP